MISPCLLFSTPINGDCADGTCIPGEAQAVIPPSAELRPKYEVLANGGEDLGAPIGGIGSGGIGRSACGRCFLTNERMREENNVHDHFFCCFTLFFVPLVATALRGSSGQKCLGYLPLSSFLISG